MSSRSLWGGSSPRYWPPVMGHGWREDRGGEERRGKGRREERKGEKRGEERGIKVLSIILQYHHAVL